MSGPEREPARRGLKWDTLGSGADLWATVVMASGFVLPADQEVREHYRIVRPLGAGGMGQVLGVVLVGSPDPQLYALKMVARPPEERDGRPLDAADRAAAEAQQKAFAALLRGEAAKQEVVQRHGVAVARLFALVRLEDGSLGLRMEVARGRSLESLLDEEIHRRKTQAPDVDFALLVMRKVLYQLRKLHELVEPGSPSGFVHSDMKPGNIFVDDGDRQDPFITLLDFGVATAGQALGIDNAAGRKSLVLQDAGGTFGYAPPHHFTGKPTPLSDVYAAMVILYEMLALQSPWDFGGLAKVPSNLFKLEDAMRKGPKPVRTGRPSIKGETAQVLDAFFAAEFESLHQLADEAHRARASEDESVRKAMNDRLRTLAHEYQGRLDQLRAQISPRVTPLPGSHPPAEPSAPTVAATPSAHVRAPSLRGAALHDVVDDDEPANVPMRPLLGWKAVVLLALIGAGVFVATQGVPPAIASWVRAQWQGHVAPSSANATPGATPVAPPNPSPAVTPSPVPTPSVPTIAHDAAVARVMDAGTVHDAGATPLVAAAAIDASLAPIVDAARLALTDVVPEAAVVRVETADASVSDVAIAAAVDAAAADASTEPAAPIAPEPVRAARVASATPNPTPSHPVANARAVHPVHPAARTFPRRTVHPAVHARPRPRPAAHGRRPPRRRRR